MSFTLINAPPSPYGRKVAIALIEKGLSYDVRYDLPWSADTCTPQFSPLQQLPILITEAGESIYDSTFILEWLEARYPSPPLLPVEVDARLEAKKRQVLGERLMEVAQSLIFELHRPEPSTAWVERQTRKVHGAFAEIERLLSLRIVPTGACIDMGDIAVGTTALVFEFVVSDGLSPPVDALRWRGRYPLLTESVARLESRPSFMNTKPQTMHVDLNATIR